MAQEPSMLTLVQQNLDQVYVTYASATGNAMSIAKRLHALLGLETPFEPLNKYTCPEANPKDKETMQSDQNKTFQELLSYEGGLSLNGEPIHFLLLVVSTTGNGDIPENGDRFFRRLKRLSRRENYQQLRGMAFALLALGDTNYSNFCDAGKKLSSLFIEMGAKEIKHLELADDATGLEVVVEPWISYMVSTLKQTDSHQGDKGNQVNKPTVENEKKEESHANSNVETHNGAKKFEGNITTTNERKNIDTTRITPSNTTSASTIISPFSPFSPCGEVLHPLLHDRPYIRISPVEAIERGWSRDFISQYFTKTFDSNQFSRIDMVKVARARQLTSENAQKSVLHFEMDISDCEQFKSYLPGDAIGIFPENSDEIVEKLFKLLDFPLSLAKEVSFTVEKNAPPHIAFPNTLFTIFKYYLDITQVVSVELLNHLSRACTDEVERRTLQQWVSPTSLNLYRINIHNPRVNLIDLLEMFPSCRPSIPLLLQLLPPQQPRYYSISSSPLKYPNEIHFAFHIVNYTVFSKQRGEDVQVNKSGLCTSFLANIAKRLEASEDLEIRIPMFMKKTPEFRLPQGENEHCPIIMIGPGTGVTPFRSFIQHRICKNGPSSTASKNWLIHGCQKLQCDFLYREEFLEMEANHNLTLHVASSQESECGWIKNYFVQDIVYEYASDIVELMEKQHGHLYLCGDAGKVFTNITNAIKYIVHEELGISMEEAAEKLNEWKETHRLQIDAW